MRKRLLAIVAAMAMVMTMIPAVAFADTGSTDVVATVNGVEYDDLQEAIKAAAPAGTVEIVKDVTVDEWVMFAEKLSIGSGKLITMNINGITINGNNHTLTINSIESAGNGDRLFYDAENLNIKDLTINQPSGGGIGLKSGKLENVTINGGIYGVLPGTGTVDITGCTFKTNGTAVYFEEARDNLTVSGCTFDQGANNVILLRGNTVFKDNTINSGRTVNVVSGSPVVSGNTFAETVRLKVYNDATATITDNVLPYVTFDKEDQKANSTFKGNELSEQAAGALEAAGCVNEPKAEEPTTPPAGGTTAPTTPADKTDGKTPQTGDDFNMTLPMALAGLAVAAMAAVVVTRRKQEQK